MEKICEKSQFGEKSDKMSQLLLVQQGPCRWHCILKYILGLAKTENNPFNPPFPTPLLVSWSDCFELLEPTKQQYQHTANDY
jgi:hypothetical protein